MFFVVGSIIDLRWITMSLIETKCFIFLIMVLIFFWSWDSIILNSRCLKTKFDENDVYNHFVLSDRFKKIHRLKNFCFIRIHVSQNVETQMRLAFKNSSTKISSNSNVTVASIWSIWLFTFFQSAIHAFMRILMGEIFSVWMCWFICSMIWLSDRLYRKKKNVMIFLIEAAILSKGIYVLIDAFITAFIKRKSCEIFSIFFSFIL